MIETSYIKRPLLYEEENIISTKISFLEKRKKPIFESKQNWYVDLFLLSTFFPILVFFKQFLVKVLNITSCDENKNMHLIYKRKFSNFNYFHLKMFSCFLNEVTKMTFFMTSS